MADEKCLLHGDGYRQDVLRERNLENFFDCDKETALVTQMSQIGILRLKTYRFTKKAYEILNNKCAYSVKSD